MFEQGHDITDQWRSVDNEEKMRKAVGVGVANTMLLLENWVDVLSRLGCPELITEIESDIGEIFARNKSLYSRDDNPLK